MIGQAHDVKLSIFIVFLSPPPYPPPKCENAWYSAPKPSTHVYTTLAAVIEEIKQGKGCELSFVRGPQRVHMKARTLGQYTQHYGVKLLQAHLLLFNLCTIFFSAN